MADVQKMMLNVKVMGLDMKFQRACEKLAVKQGVAEGDDKAINEWLDKNVGPIFEKMTDDLPQTMPAKLNAFRKEVGEETWASVATNPSLPTMVEEWHTEVVKKRIGELATELANLIGDEMSKEEVEQWVILNIASRQSA